VSFIEKILPTCGERDRATKSRGGGGYPPLNPLWPAPSTKPLRALRWGEIVSPGHDLGSPGANQSPNALPVNGGDL